jgi:hypothetical protein
MVPAGFGFFAAIVSPRELARSRWARIYLHGCAAVASMVLLLLVIGLVWRP